MDIYDIFFFNYLCSVIQSNGGWNRGVYNIMVCCKVYSVYWKAKADPVTNMVLFIFSILSFQSTFFLWFIKNVHIS